MTRKQRIISTGLLAALAAVLLVVMERTPEKAVYHKNQGQVFGTYYAIQYECGSDLHDSIRAALKEFDRSLSLFNPQSVLSRINSGADSVADDFFRAMYITAGEVHQLSDGAFDITVAPLVHLWGFGLRNRSAVSEEQVDSLKAFVGWEKLSLIASEGRWVVRKARAEVQIDAGAIAKGQSCDVIAELLRRQGCRNFLVDIGGEVVASGVNAHQEPWRIGVTKPIDDSEGLVNEVAAVLATSDIKMATSGNYRNFYYDGEQKRSHTIDPRTGYPVRHSLLSATVVSSSCMRADALATACMVLGEEKALAMIEADSASACLLIVAKEGADSMLIVQSSRFPTISKK